VPGALGETAPIVQRFEYQANPARLTKVFDPRDPARALATYEWTKAGLMSVSRDVYGRATTYGDREAWGAPKTIITPDGIKTTLGYTRSPARLRPRSPPTPRPSRW
jgi:hypothetical protein